MYLFIRYIWIRLYDCYSYRRIYNQVDTYNFLILILLYLHRYLGSRPGAQSLLYVQVGLRIPDRGDPTAGRTRLERVLIFVLQKWYLVILRKCGSLPIWSGKAKAPLSSEFKHFWIFNTGGRGLRMQAPLSLIIF